MAAAKSTSSSLSDLLISRLGQISRLAAHVIDRRLLRFGISFQEMRIVGLLMGEEQTTQRELAAKLAVRPATLSVAISKLEQQGLVQRKASSTDRRVNYLHLVDQENLGGVDEMLLELERKVTAGIAKRDLHTARLVLNQMVANLQRLYDE